MLPIAPSAPTSTGQAALFTRHTGGVNVGYSDGHAKWVKPESLAHGTTNAQRDADNDFRTDPANS